VPTEVRILAVLIAAAAASGCGGDSEEPAGPMTAVVTMSERKFTPSEVNAAADEPLAVRNAGNVGHDLKLRRDGREAGGTLVLNPGETQQLDVLFDPGDYEMYCSVPGHEEAGMKGTFTVAD
jgi:uncharacterized cupredoxin-like copper-binding protein